MSSQVTGLDSSIIGTHDFKILSDFFWFEIFILCCLELEAVVLEVSNSCLIYKCLESSINRVKSILYKMEISV